MRAARPPTEVAYRVKAAKTSAPINTVKATAIRARNNLAISLNARTSCSFD
jgi:hypothetical protein